jgi:hypothetical protein
MAYVDTYRIACKNKLESLVEVILSKKDGDATEVITYKGGNLSKNTRGSEGKWTSIYGTSIEVELWLTNDLPDPWDEFTAAETDTWKVRVVYNEQVRFYGYLLPDEGSVPIRDKPYFIKIHAVDGLGLIKEKALTMPNGENFEDHHSIITYVAAIAQATGLQLPIRVYDYYYHRSFNNRDIDYKWDMVGQTYQEARTFLEDAVTFVNCHKALEIICKDTFRFYQWEGMWVLFRIPMVQYYPFAGYYTDYDFEGANAVGYEYLDNYALVGKAQGVFPVNKQGKRSMKAGVKYAKTRYMYVPWPEIPKNNKFERGVLVNTANLTDPVRTENSHLIEDWTFGKWAGGPTAANLLPDLFGTSHQAYRRSTYNIYGVELTREIVLADPEPVDAALRNILMSDGIPVIQGDKVAINFDFKNSLDSSSGNVQVAVIMLIPDGATDPADYFYITNVGVDQGGPFKWIPDDATFTIGFINYGYSTNLQEWVTFNIEAFNEIPASGTIYVGLVTQGFGETSYFKNFSVKYTPYVAGGYLEVKGDYWITTQEPNYSGKSDEEVFLSDNQHKIFKGCNLDSAGVPLTPDWYRMGVSESKHYNQLINDAKFNLEHRRMLFVEDQYKWLTYSPQNDPTAFHALGFHKQYRHTDNPVDRRYLLGAPMDEELKTGWFTGRFYEVWEDGKGDGTTTADQQFKFIF